MEQHPVPQNVTTFQFRLIGDMTIKQFGYLAGGAILGYISYRLPLPFFFTWPLALTFGLGGVGFAFVPIEERPMDVWVLSFIKSIYSPTQFVWQQQPPMAPPVQQPVTPMTPQPSPTVQQTGSVNRTTSDVLQGMFTPAKPNNQTQSPRIVSITPQQGILQTILTFFGFSQQTKPVIPKASPVHFSTPSIVGNRMDVSPPPAVTPHINQEKIINETKEKEVQLEQKLSTLKKDLEDKSMTEARVLELQKQLTELLTQKETMQQELEALRRAASQSTAVAATVPAPANTSSVATPKTQTVKIITPESAIKAGLPRLTTFPNVVTGIIKDSENNLLPGVLVTVKDRDGMPLRALKTNRLGQFAASTPLSNGVYFVEIEDPRTRYAFDRVQITLNGSIVPAIEVVAKSQKQINRAMLEKELFGKPV
jgi:hypothetical protein